MSIGSRSVCVIGVCAFLLMAGCGKKDEPATSTSGPASGAPATTAAAPALTPGASNNLKKNDGPPFYNFDWMGKVNYPAAQKSVEISGDVENSVNGWAMDPSKKMPASGVDVVIDGVPYAAKYGIGRIDVAKHFDKPEFLKSGYLLTLAPHQLTKGPHALLIRVITNDGKSYNEGPVVHFTVN